MVEKVITDLTYKVKLLESERGWGQSYDFSYFTTEDEAVEFYSKHQPKPGPVPDYYVIAVDVLKLYSNGEWKSIVRYFED